MVKIGESIRAARTSLVFNVENAVRSSQIAGTNERYKSYKMTDSNQLQGTFVSQDSQQPTTSPKLVRESSKLVRESGTMDTDYIPKQSVCKVKSKVKKHHQDRVSYQLRVSLV